MTTRSEPYTIVVRGEVGGWLEAHLDGMCVRRADGCTEITGLIHDASHLRGVLDRLGDLGLELVRLNPDSAVREDEKALS